MAAMSELEISPATHSTISIPSSLDSQSTAVSSTPGTCYLKLRAEDDEADASPLGDEVSSTTKPTFDASVKEAPESQESLLEDGHPASVELWTLPRRVFRKRRPERSPVEDNPWKPSFKRTGPILGLTALGFILLSIPASALVLALSNGKPVDQWKVQPSVYISVLTGIGNKALGFATIQGAIITWWVKALKGTTLANLHYDWPIGNGGFNLRSRRHLSMLTVTSICAFAIVFDAILLQSATFTVEHSLQEPVTLRAMLSPEIPTNYTATGALYDEQNSYLNAEYTSGIEPIRRQWTNQLPIPSPLEGCQGTCTARVLAAALAPTGCRDEYSSWMNFTDIRNETEMRKLPHGCRQDWSDIRCQMFEVHVWPSKQFGDHEPIDITFGRYTPIDPLDKDGCAGNYTLTTCSFRSAIAEYDITTQGNISVTINNARSPRIVALANNSAREQYALNERINATIGGIALLASMDFYSDIGMRGPGTDNQYTDNINRVQSRLIANSEDYFNKKACAPVWQDPVPEVLTVLNRLMFSTSVQVVKDLDQDELRSKIDDGWEISYDVEGLRIDAQPIFRTRWIFFWGATLIQVLCVGLVGVTYWDYWKLGRTVSLSPLEIGKAFDAELLRGGVSNVCSEKLAEGLTERKVRYGIYQVGGKEEDCRFMFRDLDDVKCLGKEHAFAG